MINKSAVEDTALKVKGPEMNEQLLETTIDQILQAVDLFNQRANDNPLRQVPHDDKTIWDKILHTYTNDDYYHMFEAMFELYKQAPKHFKPHELESILHASEVLAEQGDANPRLFDQHYKKKYKGEYAPVDKEESYKTIAWRSLMSTRDVMNRITEWKPYGYAQTKTIKKSQVGGAVNTFNDLFDLPHVKEEA
jgi:hypothetical protein